MAFSIAMSGVDRRHHRLSGVGFFGEDRFLEQREGIGAILLENDGDSHAGGCSREMICAFDHTESAKSARLIYMM
jgi:hypothetical protein